MVFSSHIAARKVGMAHRVVMQIRGNPSTPQYACKPTVSPTNAQRHLPRPASSPPDTVPHGPSLACVLLLATLSCCPCCVALSQTPRSSTAQHLAHQTNPIALFTYDVFGDPHQDHRPPQPVPVRVQARLACRRLLGHICHCDQVRPAASSAVQCCPMNDSKAP